MFGFDGVYTSCNRLAIAEVYGAILRTDIRGRRSDPCLVNIEQMHPRARRLKAFRRCPTDPLCRSCHKDKTVLEFDIHTCMYPFTVILGKSRIQSTDGPCSQLLTPINITDFSWF